MSSNYAKGVKFVAGLFLFICIDLEKGLEFAISAAAIASATRKLLFFFNTSIMYGWLLIIYFKIFFVLFFHPPGRTGYIICEALCRMKIQGPVLKKKNTVKNFKLSKALH